MQKILLIPLLVILTQCPMGSPPIGHVKYWQADSMSAAIVRTQDNAKIFCVDKQIDNYTCALTEELVAYIELLKSSCQSWATKEEWNKFIKDNNCGCD